MWRIIAPLLYAIPLSQLYYAEEDPLYNDHIFPMGVVIIFKLSIMAYYSIFMIKYKNYTKLHMRVISLLIISLFSNIAICINFPNTIYVMNDRPIFLIRWAEWSAGSYILMDIIEATSPQYKNILWINKWCQVFCILFGFLSLFHHFFVFSILSTVIHLYMVYPIYKTFNNYLIIYEAISVLITVYFFMYFNDLMDPANYHISMWISELLIKSEVVILTSMSFMLNREFIMDEYIHREKVFYIIHDLRIHLNSMRLGLSQLLRSDITRLMNTSLNAMIDLINQILFFNKIYKHKLELKKDFFSLRHLLTQIFDEFSFQLSQDMIEYKLNIDKEYFIYADKKATKTIFLNLISNSLKYTNGQIHVNIRHEILENSAIIHFSVYDDGPGVPEYFIPNLFKPFSQSEHAENTSGLGLYLANKIVQAHQGTIAYKYENGAKFYGTIKSIVKETYNETITSTNEISMIRPFSNRQVRKVLLADDSNMNRRMLANVLRDIRSNYTIIQAKDGQQAIDAVIREPDIDLVFMDFHMPYKNGNEAIVEILDKGFAGNIILLTGLMKDEILRETKANCVMIKPITKNLIETFFEEQNI